MRDQGETKERPRRDQGQIKVRIAIIPVNSDNSVSEKEASDIVKKLKKDISF